LLHRRCRVEHRRDVWEPLDISNSHYTIIDGIAQVKFTGG
jgi:hypothetical protein